MALFLFVALKNLMNKADNTLRGACAPALIHMQGDSFSSETGNSASPSICSEATTEPILESTRGSTKVMLSYQRESKRLVLKIKEKLCEAGYNVWMDETHMSKCFLFCFVLFLFFTFVPKC